MTFGCVGYFQGVIERQAYRSVKHHASEGKERKKMKNHVAEKEKEGKNLLSHVKIEAERGAPFQMGRRGK